MTIRAVVVTGVGGQTARAVEQAAAQAVGGSFADLDVDGLSRQIDRIDGVGAVALDWSWFSDLHVAVTEQTPFAVYGGSSTGFTVVDRTGATARTAKSRPAKLPLLGSGGAEERQYQLSVLASLPDWLRARVDKTAVAAGDAILYLKSDQKVVWGSLDDTEAKAEVLAAVLDTDAAFINVSTPTRPALSGLPTER